MVKIGLMSDTHGYLDPEVLKFFNDCDEVWHAGDIGDIKMIGQLMKFKPFKGVYGNIDDKMVRTVVPRDQIFEIEGLKVYMTHIGGYPGKYLARVRADLLQQKPDLYICGHSHILKIMHDKKLDLLHMNPGACGNEGFHKVRTLIRFGIEKGKIRDAEVIELGPRYSNRKSK